LRKVIEYNKPAYLYFVDLQKAFDRFKDIDHQLYSRHISINIMLTIYYDNKIQAEDNGKLTNFIVVCNVIRQKELAKLIAV